MMYSDTEKCQKVHKCGYSEWDNNAKGGGVINGDYKGA